MNILPTIDLNYGDFVAPNDLRELAIAQKIMIGDWVGGILEKPRKSAGNMRIESLEVRLFELFGFDEQVRLDQIYNHTRKFFEILPAFMAFQIGLRLRLKYENQPNGDRAIICTEQIFDRKGFSGLICIGRNDPVLWIGAACGRPDFLWPKDTKFIFPQIISG